MSFDTTEEDYDLLQQAVYLIQDLFSKENYDTLYALFNEGDWDGLQTLLQGIADGRGCPPEAFEGVCTVLQLVMNEAPGPSDRMTNEFWLGKLEQLALRYCEGLEAYMDKHLKHNKLKLPPWLIRV